MSNYEVTMTHSEESLTALAHMQYDLFCTRNFVARNAISVAVIIIGTMNFSKFWGVLLVAYGAYLITSTYSASNHTVKKLVESIRSTGKGFPSSRYCFTDNGIEITFHPGMEDEEKLAPVGYGDIIKLGENADYFYLFPSSAGGYCVPKKALGKEQKSFAQFVEQKTGKRFYRRRPSPIQRIRDWLNARNSEPEHL